MEVGEQFLHQRNPKLHISSSVERAQTKLKRDGGDISTKPAKKISVYLDRLEEILNPKPLKKQSSFDRKERNIKFIKNRLQQDIIIKPRYIPNAIFLQEKQDRKDMTDNNIEITNEYRSKKIGEIIKNQKESLNAWFDYLFCNENLKCSTSIKYWIFSSVIQMGNVAKKENQNKITCRFNKRNRDTIAPFPPLNPRALAITISSVQEYLQEIQKPKIQREKITNRSKILSDKESYQLISSGNFSKLYALFLSELPEYLPRKLQETNGLWIKYPQGSDPINLVNSLSSYPLEWCTAHIETARIQLEQGDFYVYYSIDDSGKPLIPRLAIRMRGTKKIAEPPRGIAPNQNLDPNIVDILEKKLHEFGSEGKIYKKNLVDTKYLTNIETKQSKGKKLTREEIKFLYELDNQIQGFGYVNDSKITELKFGRDIKADLAFVYNCSENELSLSKQEALNGNIKFHYGSLDLWDLTSVTELILPKRLFGHLYLDNLISGTNILLPKRIDGSLNLQSLASGKGVKFPKIISGELDLSSIISASGLKLKATIKNDLILTSLTSIKNLELSQLKVQGIVYFGSLNSKQINKLTKKYLHLKFRNS